MLRDNALFSGVEGTSLARVLAVFRLLTLKAGTPRGTGTPNSFNTALA